MEDASKEKVSFYQRWWFWAIVAVVVLFAIGSSNSSSSNTANTTQSSPVVPVAQSTPPPTPTPTPKAAATTPASTAKATSAQSNAPSQQTYTTPSGAQVNGSGNVVSAPPAPPATWHTVATFSGTGDTNTNDFSIQGSKWRIDWSFAFPASTASFCEQNGCNMAVQIYQDDGTYVDQFLETGQQPSSGTVYEYSGTGNMYMHVIQGNVTWNLTVEDYY